MSRSRRELCQGSASAGATASAHAPSPVDVGDVTQYWLGALDEPLQLYRVVVVLAAGEQLRDDELGRAYCQLQKLLPLACDWRLDRLVAEVPCTAPSAEAAAWRTVERVRELTEVPLVQVEAALPGAGAPEVVLTGAQPRTRADEDERCA